MIQMDVLLSEEQIANDFFTALGRRHLPERFFYWLPLSVKAWLALCRSSAYKNFARSLALISAEAGHIASLVPGPQVEVISLGSGQGDKDAVLLEALRQAGRQLCYRPVDSSQCLLEIACQGGADAGFSTRGLKADLMDAAHLGAIPRAGSAARLYLLLGNTLGGFDPLEFVSTLSRLLGTGDFLLVDGEVYGGMETLAGYDNPTNRNFAIGPLRSVGIGEEDGELRFELGTDPRREGLYRITKNFHVGRALEVVVAGERLRFERGELITMSSSYKYTRPTFLELVSRGAGLNLAQEFSSPDERFLLVLATRA